MQGKSHYYGEREVRKVGINYHTNINLYKWIRNIKEVWNCRFEGGNMAKMKIPEKGYDRITRTIDFSHVRTHQRRISKRRITK